MTAKGEAQFQLTIKALDYFTRPFEAFGRAVENQTRGIRRFGREAQIAGRRISSALGLPQLKKTIGGVGTAFGNVGNAARGFATNLAIVGLAAGGAVAAMYKLVRVYTDAGDEAIKSAQKAGISSQQWQEWAYAGSLSDVTNEQLITSFDKLNKAVVGAASGGKGQAAVFKKLGISIKGANGLIKPTSDLMMEVSEAFSQMPEVAQKTALAMELFGKSGVQMLPLLNSGADGLKEMRREAVELGLVFEEDAAKGGEEFNDNVTRLQTRLRGLGFIIGEKLLPVASDFVAMLSEIIDENREWIKIKATEWAGKLSKALPRLKLAIKDVVGWLKVKYETLKKVVDFFGGFEGVMKTTALVMSGPLMGAITGLIGSVLKLGAVLLVNPVGWIAVAVAGFVALLAKAGALEPILEGFKQTFRGIEPFFEGFFGADLDEFNKKIKEINWQEIGREIGVWVNTALATAGTLMRWIIDMVEYWSKDPASIGEQINSSENQEIKEVLIHYKETGEIPATLNEEASYALSTMQGKPDETIASDFEALQNTYNKNQKKTYKDKFEEWVDNPDLVPSNLSEEDRYMLDRARERKKEELPAPAIIPEPPVFGKPVLGSDTVVQTQETKHTEEQKVNINITAPPGFTVGGDSGQVAPNVTVNNTPSRLGVQNNG